MMSDEQKCFEDHIRKINPKLLFIEKLPDGMYIHCEVRARWAGWQARAALSKPIAAQQSVMEHTTKDAARYQRLRENWINCEELELHGRLAVVDAVIDAALERNAGLAAINAAEVPNPYAWRVTSGEPGNKRVSLRFFEDGDIEKIESGRYGAKFEALYFGQPLADKGSKEDM